MAEALNAFLAAERMGSPIEAAERGRPVNVDAHGVVADTDLGTVVDVYPRDLMQQHGRLVRWFEAAERATMEEREAAERDRDYYDGYQLDPATMKALKARGQPPLVDNFIRDKVELLSGIERKSRTDPKAFPRTPSEEERADAATQALRYLNDDWNMGAIRSAVYQNMLIEGMGGAELGLEDDGKGGVNVTLAWVGWERIFRDPHSRAYDFADSRYQGMVVWMDRDQVEEMYPNAGDVIGEAFQPQTDTYGDRPGSVAWTDNQRERCRVVQIYWTEGGDWWGATITKTGYLAEPVRSPFRDSRGRSACPLVLMSAYIDRENRRYGIVRDMISGQDAINKRQSKALHLLSVNRIIAEKGAFDDADKARREAAKPDGYLEPNPGFNVRIETGTELASGQFQLLQIAMQRMQAKGPNAAMSGTDPRDLSGRAILAQQAGGAAANEPLVDRLRDWTRRVYEMAWMAVREYWTGERWLRVTDDMNKVEWVGLNRRITLADELAAMPEPQRAMAMQQLMLQPGDPRLQEVVRVENDITDLEVDVTIEEGADVPAQAAEQFQMLTQMVPALPPPMQVPAWKILLQSSQLKDKAQLLEMFDEAQEAAAQAQQAQAPIAQAEAEAGVAVKQSQAALNQARANDLQHGTVERIARVHKQAAESPALPVEGPGIQPQAPQGF